MWKRVMYGGLTVRDAIRGSPPPRRATTNPRHLRKTQEKIPDRRGPRHSDHVGADRVKDLRRDFNKRRRSEGFHLKCHIWTRPLQELLANNALRL